LLLTYKGQQNEWKQLFNGTNLDGWEHIGPGSFEVKDSVLITQGGMGLLWYPGQKFGNVVIRIVYTVADNNRICEW